MALIALPDGAPLLEVRAPGFIKKTAAIPHPAPPAIVVILIEADCVSGRVTYNGQAPPCSMTVVAFPSGTRPMVSDIGAREDVFIAQADANGEFELCGLSFSDRWILVAGGPGYATPTPAQVSVSDHGSCVLELEEYFFLAVECRQLDGETACLVQNMSDLGMGLNCIRRATKRDWKDLQSIQAFLAGVPLEWCTFSPSDVRRLLIAPMHELAMAEKAPHCIAEFPGYERTWDRFTWASLADGFFVQTLWLQRTTSEWGRIRLVVDGLDAARLAAIDSMIPAMTLVLSPVEGGRRIRVGVIDYPSEGLTIDCIPAGSYQWWIEPRVPLVAVKPGGGMDGILEVRSRSELSVSVARTCTLEVHIADLNGRVHTGAALLIVDATPASGPSIEHSFVPFRRAPYRLPCLPAGHYLIRLGSPSPADDSDGSAVSVDLVEGQQEDVVLIARP